jgi:Derlin-2/3
MEDLKAYILQVAPVTRYFTGITFFLSFCMTYQIISPSLLYLLFDYVGRGQIWRLLTTYFFAGPFSMNFLFAMMMNYWTINNLESHFENKKADFATLLLFNAATSMFFGWLANEYMVM